MNILLVKLITGEDIVADIEEKPTGLLLKKPARLVLTHEGVAMIPMPPFASSKELLVATQHVVFTATPDDEILNAYNAKYGSGLVMPGSGLNIVT